MNVRNAIILGLTVAGVAGALAYRAAQEGDPAPAEAAPQPTTAAVAVPAPAPAPLPRLVELGSDRCTSCKAMMPVLAELRAAHAGKLQVDFIDVWKHPDEAERYKISIIPTQIFFGADGKELFRHQGFFAADAIRARFGELGYPLPVPDAG